MVAKKIRFIPKNTEKYLQPKKCMIAKSTWEYEYMRFLDDSDAAVRWGYEHKKIRYYNEIKKKYTTYVTDFYFEKKINNVIFQIIIEVKPMSQLYPPQRPKDLTAHGKGIYERALKVYIINKAKWIAANEYCKKLGMYFYFATKINNSGAFVLLDLKDVGIINGKSKSQ